MIVVGVRQNLRSLRGSGDGRLNHQRIGGVVGGASQAVNLSGERCEAVRLMTAQMRNAGQLNAALHESAGSRHGRRQLTTGRQVKGEVTLGKLRGTGHGQTALSVANLRTQCGQKLTPHIAHLGRTRRRIIRGRRPVRNSHRLAGNHGGGKERTGIRQVRLNGHLKAGERTGVNRPTVLAALCFVALVRVVLLNLDTHLA